MTQSLQGQPDMANNNSNYAHFDADLAKAKIFAEIMQMLADGRKKDAETAKINAEILNSFEERMKTVAETAKINKETVWYPLLIATGLIGAIAALIKLFF